MKYLFPLLLSAGLVGAGPAQGPYPLTLPDLLDYKYLSVVPVSLAQGYPKSFGFKASRDGTNWETIQYNVNFTGSNANEKVFAPWITYYGTNFVVCWDAMALGGGAGLIGEAISPDLLTWTRVPGFITNGAAMGNVFGGTFFLETNNILYNVLPAQNGGIYLTAATNASATAWGPTNLVVSGPRDASIIKNGGTYFMFACTNNSQITILTNTVNCTNQYFTLVANVFTSLSVEAPQVFKLPDGTFILYVHGNPGGVQKELYSKSTDLVTWTALQEINENGTVPGRMTMMALTSPQQGYLQSLVNSNVSLLPYKQVYYLTTGPGSLTATSQARPFGGFAAAKVHYDVVAMAGQTNANSGATALQPLVATFSLEQSFEQDGQIPGIIFTNGPIFYWPPPVRPDSTYIATITMADAASGVVNGGGWNTGPMLKVVGPASTWIRWKVTENVDVSPALSTNQMSGSSVASSGWFGYGYDVTVLPQAENFATLMPNVIITPTVTNFTAYASGTAYTLTTTPTLLGFGTTTPSVTINQAGTYLISAGIGVKYSGATYAGAQTITLKLRRTNNTAADLTGASRVVELPVLTTFTGGDAMTTPSVVYTATSGDIIQIFGSVSATPAAGSVLTDSAEVVAIRLY